MIVEDVMGDDEIVQGGGRGRARRRRSEAAKKAQGKGRDIRGEKRAVGVHCHANDERERWWNYSLVAPGRRVCSRVRGLLCDSEIKAFTPRLSCVPPL